MKLQINPAIDFWLSVAMACVAALATGAVPYPDTINANTQHEIKQWAAFIIAWYTIVAPLFPGLSSARTGPLTGAKVSGAAIVLFGLGLAFVSSGSAHATPLPPHRPIHAHAADWRRPVSTVALPNLPAKILNDAITDLTATIALANAQKDAVAVACYSEILTELTAVQNSQSGAANLPAIHLFYTFQTARGFANAAMPNSALNNACAPLAQQVKLSVLTLINGLVTGSLGVATIGPMFGLP